ncbi:MAG: 5-oxoprolinase subunit PxpB [Actinobacteria bacterium]|nr:MAG: 5-oxoprolinase subunit PxpB [Actinomycetota bacterium]
MHWVGDRALLRSFPGELERANRAAHACGDELAALEAPEVEDVVPGARSILVVLRPGAEPSDALRDLLGRDRRDAAAARGRLHEIPVRYGGADGPDLADVASLHGLTEAQAIEAHARAAYVVGFIGFSPGFPYLLGLDPALATPRLDTPRVRVAAGSVAIGGGYTGVYPGPTPGGWRLIGRTDVELFDPLRDPPALLAPGDRVRFLPR